MIRWRFSDDDRDLDQGAVRQLVDRWYQALDVHAPFEELVPYVASTGLEMYWPEGPTFGVDGFQGLVRAREPGPSSTRSTR